MDFTARKTAASVLASTPPCRHRGFAKCDFDRSRASSLRGARLPAYAAGAAASAEYARRAEEGQSSQALQLLPRRHVHRKPVPVRRLEFHHGGASCSAAQAPGCFALAANFRAILRPAIQQAAVDAWSLGSRQDRDRREAMWRGRNSEPERGLRIDCVGSPYSTLGVYLEVISSAICRFKVVRLVRW